MSRPTRQDAGGRAYLDLQNRARREGRGTQELLIFYVLERFLARLSASEYVDQFVLKGGMLLAVLNARRPTVDADLLAMQLANDEAAVLDRVTKIASRPLPEDDGVQYLIDTAKTQTIRDGDLYSGVRVTMQARVAAATVKLQLDVNFGDPVTPGPVQISYPTLREAGQPVHVLGYPMATVLAEKITTAIDLGESSTRMRDYADIWTLTGVHDIDGHELSAALAATAEHRSIMLQPLSEVIGDLEAQRRNTYTAYRRRLSDDGKALPLDLKDVVADVIAFADPLLRGDQRARWRASIREWA